MINKTTVKGYVIQRVQCRPANELERWSVDKNRIYLGNIVKAIYKHPGEKPLVFWYFNIQRRIGYRYFWVQKVANTRTEIILLLAKAHGIEDEHSTISTPSEMHC